ncbi:aspartate carbamoyltransferase regulatory subunit [Eubacterium sp. AB3007]|jgi:aspartate carbamoyltransferase regulatory subunit|uniref:aspartate carbamoyltransferase regulatory subunit n=1 Tax=Eubacterium sp. AB3007 TaxID=1392487 RepID=UPI000489AE31|nr:aspartate carbamoyltransferase regulatory subunit [Eubacterium sp. AB3007]
MNIDGVNNGVVLDHIQAGKSNVIYDLMRLDKLKCCVAIIQNADSEKYGKKDIIKVDGDFNIDYQILGYVDDNITVNIVKNGELQEKVHLDLPEELTNVIKCKNPRCITSIEQEIPHRFKLSDKARKSYRCIYCDAEYK